MLRQGLLGEHRTAYWKFLFHAATKYPYACGTAVALAIMGHHFQVITRAVCEPARA